MSNHREWDPACKIYVGGLRDDANRYDIEDVFSKYGSVRDVWVARKPPGFAFVEMEDARDAKDAARDLNGTRICGVRVRVEMSKQGSRGGGDRDRERRRRTRSRSRSGSRGRSGRGSRRSPSYSKGSDRDRRGGSRGRSGRYADSRSRSRS